MASYSGSYSGPSTSSSSSKKVKPLLKKFTQSEKSSIDLNRPLTEQNLPIGTGSRSAQDPSFSNAARRGYHTRSTSAASQFSTNTSGSFVHPFQQTPRPYTPTIVPSYSGSVNSADYPREHSSLDQARPLRSASNLSNHTTTSISEPASTHHPALRLQTKSTSTSRLAYGGSQLNLTSSLNMELVSPTDNMSPISAVRSSMDPEGPFGRIRSRSELDTRARADSVREARRKFEEKEQAKEEKAAREAIKAIEKKNQKEARQHEKGHRKPSIVSQGGRSKRSGSDLNSQEKNVGFIGRDYNSAAVQTPPTTAESFAPPPRTRTGASTTKKKTHSAWTTFMMWLRTRFLRMGKPSGER